MTKEAARIEFLREMIRKYGPPVKTETPEGTTYRFKAKAPTETS